MRCLVKQFSTDVVGYEANKIPQYVFERYKIFENTGFAPGRLLLEESCDLISRFAVDQGKTMIIVDALDECNETTRHLLIKGFNDIISTSSGAVVKLLISSRDSPNLATYFEEHQTYEVCVERNRNQQDIDTYVKKQLSVLVSQKRIRLDESKPPSAKLQALIVTRLCNEAQGM